MVTILPINAITMRLSLQSIATCVTSEPFLPGSVIYLVPSLLNSPIPSLSISPRHWIWRRPQRTWSRFQHFLISTNRNVANLRSLASSIDRSSFTRTPIWNVPTSDLQTWRSPLRKYRHPMIALFRQWWRCKMYAYFLLFATEPTPLLWADRITLVGSQLSHTISLPSNSPSPIR